MREVDRPFVVSELPEKRPVVGCDVGDRDRRQVGPHFLDMDDLGGELRLQRRLASFRPRGSPPSASWKLTVPQDASHQRASLPRRAERNPSSEMGQEAASSGTVSASWATPSFPLQHSPASVNRRLRQLDDGSPA